MAGRPIGCVAALILGVNVGVATAAEIVPYTGNLDRDGIPVDGAARLRFRLYSEAQAPAAGSQDPCNGSGLPQCVWAEEHPQVAVHNGAFTVRLGRPAAPGEARDIAPILRRKTPLFLEVAVFDQARNDFAALGRQELHPAPQAVFTLQPDIEVDTLTATTANVGVLNATGAVVGELSVDRLAARTVDAAGTTFTGGVTLAPGSELTVNALPFKGLRVGHVADPARGIAGWSGQTTLSQDCVGLGATCNSSAVLPVVDPARSFCALTLTGAFEVRESVNWMCAVYRSAEPGTPWKLDKRQINNSDNSTQVGCQATCLEW